MLTKIEFVAWRGALRWTTTIGCFQFICNRNRLQLGRSFRRKFVNRALSVYNLVAIIYFVYDLIECSPCTSHKLIMNLLSLIYLISMAVVRITHDFFAEETVDLINQVLLTNSTLGKIITFKMKLLNEFYLLVGVKYIGKRYVKHTRLRALGLISTKWTGAGCAVPYFLMSLIFKDETRFITTGVSEYLNLNTTWRWILFFVTQPFLQLEMHSLCHFTAFGVLYWYFVIYSWLQRCWWVESDYD